MKLFGSTKEKLRSGKGHLLSEKLSTILKTVFSFFVLTLINVMDDYPFFLHYIRNSVDEI